MRNCIVESAAYFFVSILNFIFTSKIEIKIYWKFGIFEKKYSWRPNSNFSHVAKYSLYFNPFTTGVENESWLRGWSHFYHVIWLALGQVESYLIQTFSKKVKNDKGKIRTRADGLCYPTVHRLRHSVLSEIPIDFKNKCQRIYCMNEFMTCYLIFDFRPTYFSYFQKISANSNSHNVKKEVEPKDTIPVVKGLTDNNFIKHTKYYISLFSYMTVTNILPRQRES